jgi:hypothetical protein
MIKIKLQRSYQIYNLSDEQAEYHINGNFCKKLKENIITKELLYDIFRYTARRFFCILFQQIERKMGKKSIKIGKNRQKLWRKQTLKIVIRIILYSNFAGDSLVVK